MNPAPRLKYFTKICWFLAFPLALLSVAGCARKLPGDYALNQSYPLQRPFRKDQGWAWKSDLQELKTVADGNIEPDRSTLELFEGDRKIGPAHSSHELIRKNGGGAYSHWQEALYFSSSDNTDPNVNGRHYSFVIRPRATPNFFKNISISVSPWTVAFWAAVSVLMGFFIVAVVASAREIRRSRSIAALVLPLFNGGLVAALYLNFIPVNSLFGRALYVFLGALTAVSFIVTTFLLIGRDRPGPALKALQAWFAFVSLLLIVEIGFRVFPSKDTFGYNPGIKFWWPDWVYYPLNNFGFREPDFQTDKTPGTFRILLAGDSFVEGAGLSRSETFGAVLERAANRMLAETGRVGQRVQVYSLGHCGFNTREEVEMIEKAAPALRPDLVILAYFLNDSETHPLTVKLIETAEWKEHVNDLFLTQLHSYAYHWGFSHLVFSKQNFKTYEEYWGAQHEKSGAGWRDVASSLAHLSEYLRARRIQGLGIIWPALIQPKYTEGFLKIHRQVEEEFRADGLPVIELLPALEYKDQNLFHWATSSTDYHPNREADAEIGEFLAKNLMATYLAVPAQHH